MRKQDEDRILNTLPTINIKSTGENIKRLREKKGISVVNLAKMLGITHIAIYIWQNGRAIPSVDNLVALSKIFGVSIEDILVVEDGLQETV